MDVQTNLYIPHRRKPSLKEEIAVIYARFSSHSQGEQSIEGQLSAAHAYARAHGYTVAHEYIDRAMTGRNDNRDEFQRMLSDTSKRQFTVIIVWKVDRFGRNREEIAFNKHTCKKNGVRVEYVAENLPDTPEAIILESVLEGMAEYYSVQLSQNILRGQLESAKKCQCIGGTIPLGYSVDPETKKFVVNPKTAPIVRTIFEMYSTGSTISEIINYLNEAGIRTSRGSTFTKNSLTKLLHNEKYIGIYAYKDIIRVENGVPALIDKPTFDRVQELLKINRRAPSHRWNYTDFILTDKLFCGNCGSAMVGESGFSHTGAKYSYYSCTRKRRERTCSRKAVRQDWIEPIVLEQARAVLFDDELMEYIVDQTWAYYQKQDETQEKRAALEAQLSDVQKGIDNLVRAVEAGMFNPAVIARMDALEAQKQALTASIAEYEIASGFKMTRDHIAYFLYRLRDFDVKDKDAQKRLIQTFINSVFIYDDRIKFVFNYSGESNTVTLESLNGAEQGAGFVCCAPCSTIASTYEPEILIFSGVFVLTVKAAIA